MRPYVVRFISSHSNVGKTFVVSHVVAKLKSRGYRIGVVKHCVHGLNIENKDTHRYLYSGADVVVASSNNLGAVYYGIWNDSLIGSIKYTGTPIVVVEGFKDAGVGDTIAVIEKKEDIEAISGAKNIVAYVLKGDEADMKEYRDRVPLLFTFDKIDELANFIENRALDHIYQQLPKADCSHCGYDNCWTFARAYARGETQWCPRDSEVSLVIDGRRVELNPYVKRALRSILLAFIDTLRDVPKDKRRVTIEISL